ncbi:GNAT family N-acetyltransferase [Lysobacter tyrosinilyticus]
MRPLHNDDLPWLRGLYASTRAAELAPVPWPDQIKRDFLDQQFALQHRHYLAHYADAEFLAIERHGRGPVGRYYLQRATPEHLIVDIALLPDLRGSGVGSALIRGSQEEAIRHGCGMYLHVATHNLAARRLYERLGFRAEGEADTHQLMRWQSASVEDGLV